MSRGRYLKLNIFKGSLKVCLAEGPLFEMEGNLEMFCAGIGFTDI